MFISRTPLRVSFVGGGTDLPSFYRKQPGAVISMAVDKYVYITVNRRFDHTLRLSYSKTEIVDTLDEVQHPLFRESIRHTGLASGLEVTSIADIPSGTGLGSSSSFTVGLLHSLYAYQGKYKTPEQLADEACHLEIDVLGEPIGKQDQYAAAIGGLRRYDFNPDGSVYVNPVICSSETKAALFERLMFFYVGGARDARQVLAEQSNNVEKNAAFLQRIRCLVDAFWNVLNRSNGVGEIGEILDEAWTCKKQLAAQISNSGIDELYEGARRAGAAGGKLLGAGMGGFLMLFCDPGKQSAVREALRGVREVQFGLELEGSRIVYVGG
jgi:D-glycero-alpha-D-manno-heptose-7-phosphate kinase